MIAKDAREKEIFLGNEVKYLRTHTKGRVEDIIYKGGSAWIKISSTGLYYRSDFLEILGYKLSNRDPINKKAKDNLNILNKIKKIYFKEISDHPDGPGYGGG